MKKNAILLVFLLTLAGGLAAERVAVLGGVFKPSMIDIAGDRLFVMDVDKVRVYSLKDYRHIISFGRKGSGPGEYNVTRVMPLRILAHRDYLMVEAINKLLFFTHDGEYQREIKKFPMLNIVQPAGNGFVGRRIIQPDDASLSTSSVWLYDSQMQEIKKIFQQDFIQQGGFPNLTFKMGRDFLLFKVADDKIFVDESARGPHIGVYDLKGNRLYEITVPYQEIPITAVDRKDIVEEISRDPHIQWQLSQFNISWEGFSEFFKYDWPKYYPAIQTMEVNNGKLYINTFRVKEGRNEYIIMDFTGNVLKTLFIEPTVERWVMSTMMGVKLETIHDDKIYFIAENDDEEWELGVVKVGD